MTAELLDRLRPRAGTEGVWLTEADAAALLVYIRKAVEAEREACAKIFDDMAHAHELNYTAANAEGLRGEAEAEGARMWQRRRDAERLRARGEVAK